MGLPIFLFLATLLSTSRSELDVANPIRLLPPRSTAGGLLDKKWNCRSWLVEVEAHNIREWVTVPESCLNDVENYMRGNQYRYDCELMAATAIDYARSLKIAGDGKDVWVFDIDETLLSNLRYLAGPDFRFGAKPMNAKSFYEWMAAAKAPPLPAVLSLYNTVVSLGFKTVILTGAPESLRERRTVNLHEAGYANWESLILRDEADMGKTQEVYKSEQRKKLVKKGYRIVANVGDQWTGLIGDNVGNRSFKVPNPAYYAA